MRVTFGILIVTALSIEIASGAPVDGGILTANGKPIEPICLSHLGQQWVDLLHCKSDDIILEEDQSRPDAGTTGYGFHTADISGGYINYKNLGVLDGHPVVVIWESGGGSGNFSQVSEIEIRGNFIREFKNFGTGDRCSGLVNDAKLSNDVLSIDASTTPDELFRDASQFPQPDPKGDLDSLRIGRSGGNCFATVHTENGKLTKITLNREYFGGDRSDLSPYSRCFEGLFEADVKKNKLVLSSEEVTATMNAFVANCEVVANASETQTSTANSPRVARVGAAEKCDSLVGKKVKPQSIEQVLAQLRRLPSKKDEFETTAAYQVRLNRATNILPASYIIPVPMYQAHMAYDADKQRFSIDASAIGEGFSGFGSGVYGGDQITDFSCALCGRGYGYISVKVSEFDTPNGTYTGGNAFGVLVSVSKITRHSRVIFGREAVKVLEDLFPIDGSSGPILDIAATPTRAQALKSQVQAALVVYPKSPYFVSGEHHEKPTIDDPRDITEDIQGLVSDIRWR